MKNPAALERGSRPRVATVAEACERHIAAQSDPRTASTYRSRLRPLMLRRGDLAAPEALASLDDLERDLACEVGPERAHKAVTLVRAALREEGFELLTLIDAAAQHNIAIPSLRDLVDGGHVRCRYRRRHGRGESLLFDPDELAEDLERLPRCHEPGCDAPATGTSGHCGEHFAQGGRERAREAERRLLDNPERDWMTAKEATQESGLSPVTVNSAIKAGDRAMEAGRVPDPQAGELRSTKEGRLRRINRTDYDAWLAARPGNRARMGPRLSPDTLTARREQAQGRTVKGDSRAEIAEDWAVCRTTISNDLDAMGVERPGKGRQSRRLPPEQRAECVQQELELYREGHTHAEIAPVVGRSATQIARDLRAAGVVARPAAPRCSRPAPEERRCELCGDSFAPEFPSHDARRFCCDEHRREARALAVKDALDDRGLLGTDELGLPGIGRHQALVHINAGRLKAELVLVSGSLGPAYGVRPEDRDEFARKFAREGDGRRRVFEDPEQLLGRRERDGTIARLVASGHSLDEVHAIVRAEAKRRRDYFARYRRTGRPRRGAASPSHVRWLERFDELCDERDYHRQRIEQGWVDTRDGPAYDEADAARRASDFSLAAQVFREDWLEHPECWRGYPPAPDDPGRPHPKWERQAADTILRAIKRLQNAQTRSPAD